MTFENKTRGEFHDNRKNIGTKQEHEANKDPELTQAKKTGHPKETVGLIGGQPIDDQRGLDISQYTGPGSKPSSQFKDPDAPYHTGPGTGLSQEEEAQRSEWENPEPQNDSF
jgi:hypothetical protein